MSSSMLDSNNTAQWFQNETEKIRSSLVDDLHRIETDINEQFSVFANNFQLRHVPIAENNSANAKQRQINEARLFVPRNSLLTDLFEISHIRSIRNVFVAVLFIFVIQVMINDMIQYGKINLDFELIFQCFGKIHMVLFIWFLMYMSTAVVVFMAYHQWVKNRVPYLKNARNLKIYDTTWLLIYVAYIVLFLVYPCREIIKHQLPVASSLIILLEQLRQLMKTYSFIRENVEKVLQQSQHIIESDSNESLTCPDYSHYLYFLFAPTLLYRDDYPRNAVINWNFVLQMFSQVIAAIFYVYYVVIRFCIPTFENLNQNQITLPIFISVLFNSIMPGSLFLLLGFYGFLHCWLNAFAEMLRFADRMFYKDWWNSTSFAAYYRTWNVVVHDWLYTYIYKEIFLLMGSQNRIIPSISVILISAAFHEYVMMFALGFFYPVMFLLFGVVGMLFLFFLPRNRGVLYNILLWALLMTGLGLQSCFYFMEVYARKSCPSTDTIWDKVVPRSIACRFSLQTGNQSHTDL